MARLQRPIAYPSIRLSLIRLGRLWLALFALSVAAALGANLIAGVPIPDVVDVVLAAVVLVMAALLVFELVQAVLRLVEGEPSAAAMRVLLAASLVLLPAAPLLAFDGYAWLRHAPLLGASAVYDQVIGSLARALIWPANLLSKIIAFCLNGGSAYASYVGQAKTLLEAVYYALGILAALGALRSRRRSGGELI